MKTATFSAILLMFITTALTAQPPERGRGRGRGGPGGPTGFLRMLPLMIALDADEDGEISSSEIENAATALKTLDQDGNGKLTEDELVPEFSGRGRGFGGRGGDPAARVKQMMERDADEDGKLSEDEVPERMRRIFGRADANEDGFVTEDELTEFFKEDADGGRRARGRNRDRERPDGERGRRPRRPE